ncbi:MAG TPA: D-alanyl-D-alanine carboxypeptidase/D-alanyl-D-alanine-endopeptidase [Gaiellaceae bacterium]|nr:D-alanyl-D-alanine carboxypeptidase/D-alanyl-D-alanine-endopeptidase [Gaiellaceae bacterium]
MQSRARLLVALLVAALLAPAAASARALTLQQRLAKALHVSHVSLADAGATVVDLETGETVFSHNAGLSLVPASNEKLAVTYAALTALGPAFRIETDVLGSGIQQGTTWRGDLYLKGYGDPTLSNADLASLARQVAADGIRRVSGRLLGDESWFDTRRTALGWKASYYLTESPPLSALIVNRGWTGHRTSTQPALAATQLFRKALAHAGVTVTGKTGLGAAPDEAEPLADVESATVAALLRRMDRVSDNFYAEMLLKQLGAVQGARGSTAGGVGVVTGLLAEAGVPLAGVRMADGSGLSLFDRWTPTALVTLLRAMWDDPGVRPELLASLPVAGRTGTLHNRMRTGPARGLVRAKTGTTSRASALSGFVGDRYAFSVLENGFPVSWTYARRSQDRFATVLASVVR